MQINPITNNTNPSNRYLSLNNKSRIAFEGIKLKHLIKNTAKKAKKREHFNYFCSKIANIIDLKTSEVISLAKDAGKERLGFLNAITSHYNKRNFYLDNNLKESPKALIETFQYLTSPKIVHYNIVDKTNAPFESILQIFKLAKDNKSLSFVQNIQHNILDGSKKSADLIIDMLKSENKNKYISETQNYSSYLKLNSSDEDAIKKLDKLISEGRYEKKEYDKKYEINKLLKNIDVKTFFKDKPNFLEENYSQAGQKFLENLFNKYHLNLEKISQDSIDDILKMYKSSTPENISARIEILNKFGKYYESTDTSEIKSMKRLFKKIDSDKSSANFVYKILGDNLKASKIEELNTVLDIVPPQKAEIFHKNIARIIKYTNKTERINALKNEVENPFFITKYYENMLNDSIKAGFTKKESKLNRIARLIENKINIIRYSRIEETPVQNSIKSDTITAAKPIIETTQTTNTVSEITPKLELKRTFKESKEAKKLRIQSEISEIIKHKLGQKTLEKQKDLYNNGAMVMRLKLLPEIFNSITDTRKIQKAAGKRPRVETRDAIKLYSRINGKNKKVVNYMLKQTNSDGQRIYDIKDIIQKLNVIEQKIKNKKLEIGKEFNANDAKNIYQHEYETLFAQYGKLKRASKKKS